jgi:hypothetical protein
LKLLVSLSSRQGSFSHFFEQFFGTFPSGDYMQRIEVW